MIRRLSIILLLFGFCSSGTGQVTKSDVAQFLGLFEDAVKRKDEKAVLYLMDPIFRKEQHDDLLEGNTTLFLKEFFCGSDGAHFHCYELKDIKKIKKKGLEQISGSEWKVIYQIKTKDKTRLRAEWIIIPHKDGTHEALGLVGAVG